MTGEALFVFGFICGMIGSALELRHWLPRGVGLAASLAVVAIVDSIVKSPKIRHPIFLVVVLCVISVYVTARGFNQFHRCVFCRRIIWPWQNRAHVLSSSVVTEGVYHNSTKRACLKWPKP